MYLLSSFSYLQQFFAEQFALYNYQNYFEIIILSFLIYKALQWLQSDHTKPMVLYLYMYAGTLILSNLIGATTLFWILIICSPIASILCIIAHQKNIQKYFAWKNIHRFDTESLPDKEWMELLVRSILFAAHHKKNIFCIIQRNDYIQHLIEGPYNLNIPIQKNVLDLIFSSPMIENPSVILVTQFGTLKFVNALWSNRMLDHMMLLGEHDSLVHSQEAALVLSRRTDAIIIHITTNSEKNTIWYQDTHLQNLSTEQILIVMKKLLPQASVSKNNQGVLYENKPHSSDSTSPHN
jgi:DNA integrity scanning protein DisA with diadenylate cyclase activity